MRDLVEPFMIISFFVLAAMCQDVYREWKERRKHRMRDQLATWKPSPHYWKGRGGHSPKWIILHGTAGPGAVSWFQNQQSQVSAHYVIERDGSVICCVEEDDSAWGNGVFTPGHAPFWDESLNPNLVTISIEHTKLTKDNSDSLTEAQKQASFKLVKSICNRWNIPAREADAQGGITGHYSIDPVNRSRCPGPYPWVELWAYLKKGENTMVPNGWKDNGTTLTASNNVPVVRGFREAILASRNWDPNNVPLQSEQAIQGGSEQVFGYCILRWSDDQGVYFAPTGLEILNLRSQIASLQGADAEKYRAALERIKTIIQAL